MTGKEMGDFLVLLFCTGGMLFVVAMLVYGSIMLSRIPIMHEARQRLELMERSVALQEETNRLLAVIANRKEPE